MVCSLDEYLTNLSTWKGTHVVMLYRIQISLNSASPPPPLNSDLLHRHPGPRLPFVPFYSSCSLTHSLPASIFF